MYVYYVYILYIYNYIIYIIYVLYIGHHIVSPLGTTYRSSSETP